MLASDAEINGLSVLTRLAKRRPAGEALLRETLDGRLAVLFEMAIRATVETGDPLGKILAQSLSHEGTVGLWERVLDLLANPAYAQSVPLQEVSLTAGEKLLQAYREAWPEPDRTQRGRLAALYRRLSFFRSAKGLLEEALAAAEEACELFLDLYQDRPTEHAAGYAGSLLSVAASRRALGRAAPALQAAREAMKMSESLPREELGLLAASHEVLGGILYDLGLTRDAEGHYARSVHLFRELTAEGHVYFNRSLVTGLAGHAVVLWELGRSVEARAAGEEAMAAYRQLVAVRPDLFLLDYARSLAFLGLLDRELARYDDAIAMYTEAAKALAQLAHERPESFQPDLAMVLATLSLLLRETGRPHEAFLLDEEVLEIRRELAAVAPERFVPDLAASLMSQSNNLIDLGRGDEALRASEEGLSLLRLHARQARLGLPADLARGLLVRARQLSHLGFKREALAHAQEALGLFRHLAAEQPEVFGAELIASLLEMAHLYETLDLGASAAELKREVAALTLKPSNEKKPETGERTDRNVSG